MKENTRTLHYLALIPANVYSDFLSSISPYGEAMLNYFICEKRVFLGQVCHVFAVFDGGNKSFLDYISPHFIEQKAKEIANTRNVKLKKTHFKDAFREIITALYSDGIFMHITEC